jgi:tetratricopeptide (TPR) repeat protein
MLNKFTVSGGPIVTRLVWLLIFGSFSVFPLFSQSTASGQNTGQIVQPVGSGGTIYISGRVAMEDSSPVPQGVTIQRICGGVSKTVAYTDTAGRFSFQWGEKNMIVTDAADAGAAPTAKSTSPGYGASQNAGGASAFASDPFGNKMTNCVLRANVAGFTSDKVDLFNRKQSDSPDIGLIVLHRNGAVEGGSVSVTSMMAPKDAKKAYDRGLESLLKNKPSDAAKDFEKATALYPKYAEAWMNLGKVRLQQNSVPAARTAFLKAMDADPKLVPPYVEMGALAAKEANWAQSGEYLDKALKLDPVDYPAAWYADAVAHYNLKSYEAAEKCAREAVKLDPKHANPRSGYLLGLVLAEKRDYAGAAAELTNYMKLAPNAPDLRQVQDQLGQLEKLMGGAKQASAVQP